MDHQRTGKHGSAHVSRRAFTAATMATAAGMVAMPRAGLAGQTTDGRRVQQFRKAVKFDMINIDAPVLAKFRLLRELGYDGVEIGSPNALDPKEVIDARNETGLVIHGTVCSTHWSLPLSDPDAEVRRRGREGVLAAIRDCHRYGGNTVLLVPAVVNARVPYDEAYRRSQDEIRTILPAAADVNVHLTIENVWNHFLLSPLEAARYIDEFESDRIGWYFDIGNVVNFGWPVHWVRSLGPRIRKLDIKDFSRAKRDTEGLWRGFAVEIGEGDVDWPAVIAELRAIRFSGWATAEVAGGGEDRLRDIYQRMSQVLRS